VCDTVTKNNPFNFRYFNSTLFNLPNISETDAEGNLINIDFKSLQVDSDGNIYYELPIRTEIIAYQPGNSENSINSARQLSEQVKNHYLNESLIASIDKVLRGKIESIVDYNDCSNEAIEYFLHEIKDEILSQRGNLDRVLFSEIFKEITKSKLLNLDKFNNLDQLPNVFRNKKIIHDTRKISDKIINAFEEHTKNRILHQNYYSYGDINLKQNETITLYQIPVDKKCLLVNLKNKFTSNKDKGFIAITVEASNFFGSTHMIQKYLDDYKDYNKKFPFKTMYSFMIKNYEDCKNFELYETALHSKQIVEYMNMLKKFDEKDITNNFSSNSPSSSGNITFRDLIDSLEKILEKDFTVSDFVTNLPTPLMEGGNVCYKIQPSSVDDEDDSIDSLASPSPDSSASPSPGPSTGNTSKAPFVKCSKDFSVKNNTIYLKIFRKIIPILYFYDIIKTELFTIDNNKFICQQIYNKLPVDKEKDEFIGIIKKINSKLAEYNTFINELHKKMCESPYVPPKSIQTPPKQEPLKPIPDIFTYYKDMIFSVFDRD